MVTVVLICVWVLWVRSLRRRLTGRPVLPLVYSVRKNSLVRVWAPTKTTAACVLVMVPSMLWMVQCFFVLV